jgi:hypothetical protein
VKYLIAIMVFIVTIFAMALAAFGGPQAVVVGQNVLAGGAFCGMLILFAIWMGANL